MQKNTGLRFILVNVVPTVVNDGAALYDLEELKSLVLTFGGAVIVKVIQRKSHPDAHTYMGSGKAAEVAEMIKPERIDVVVLNAVVKPTQLFHLTQMFWKANPNIRVWDRIDLILHIFEKHVHTAEAKLQIELARMRHMGPRIYGMGFVLSRQGGGIGTRGLGETNTELMKRHWRREMKKTQEKLEKLVADREAKMARRRENGLQTISIIGYTNAGKTSLFNLLTKKKKYAADALFATLDSHVGKVYVPSLQKEVLVSDTIGFIQNLPTKLIDAFKSTLLESMHADLLVHVIDASDPLKFHHIDVVQQVLQDLGAHNKKQIYVFNKMDKAVDIDKAMIQEHFAEYKPQFISVKEAAGTTQLIDLVGKLLV